MSDAEETLPPKPSPTFMQAVYAAVGVAIENEQGRAQTRGFSKDQVKDTVRAITEALDKLPPETSLHVVLFGLTFVRNAIIHTMEENQQRLIHETGGSA